MPLSESAALNGEKWLNPKFCRDCSYEAYLDPSDGNLRGFDLHRCFERERHAQSRDSRSPCFPLLSSVIHSAWSAKFFIPRSQIDAGQPSYRKGAVVNFALLFMVSFTAICSSQISRKLTRPWLKY
jgi:hypothetical protein